MMTSMNHTLNERLQTLDYKRLLIGNWVNALSAFGGLLIVMQRFINFVSITVTFSIIDEVKLNSNDLRLSGIPFLLIRLSKNLQKIKLI